MTTRAKDSLNPGMGLKFTVGGFGRNEGGTFFLEVPENREGFVYCHEVPIQGCEQPIGGFPPFMRFWSRDCYAFDDVEFPANGWDDESCSAEELATYKEILELIETWGEGF